LHALAHEPRRLARFGRTRIAADRRMRSSISTLKSGTASQAAR